MVCEPNPGILDFQDAVHGPITYDLVSLLRDAYVDWPEERVIDWCILYWELARNASLPVHPDFGDFYRAFEWMCVHRQLKVVGIFARTSASRSHTPGKIPRWRPRAASRARCRCSALVRSSPSRRIFTPTTTSPASRAPRRSFRPPTSCWCRIPRTTRAAISRWKARA